MSTSFFIRSIVFIIVLATTDPFTSWEVRIFQIPYFGMSRNSDTLYTGVKAVAFQQEGGNDAKILAMKNCKAEDDKCNKGVNAFNQTGHAHLRLYQALYYSICFQFADFQLIHPGSPIVLIQSG
jgi:hypothetical protein